MRILTQRFAVADHSIVKFVKKILGESEIEAVEQRLGRLTQEEARMTGAQTLEVVHGLVNSIKVVMNGTQFSLRLGRCLLKGCLARWKGINKRHSTSSWYVCLAYEVLHY